MRLPEYLTTLSPVGETLTAMEAGEALLAAETAARNAQLSVATADSGLALWEADYALAPQGGTAARRSRVRAAMAGGQTLTAERLAQLAVTVGGADRGVVEEDFPNCRVTLLALYEDRTPEDAAALEEAVARLKPAHLTVEVLPVLALRGAVTHYTARAGKAQLRLHGLTEQE